VKVHGRGLAAGATIAAAVAAAPAPARAVDAFEIQVYDGTADEPGASGLEVHANHVAAGARTLPTDARDANGETHLTLEPSHGMSPIWEIGAYLQTALDAEGGYHYAGVKLRSKWVTPKGWRPHARLGINVELSWLPATYDPGRWGAELRPIAAWEDERWLLAGNPILDFALAGPGVGDGPAFEPAIAVKRKLRAVPLLFGLEYYGGFGPIASPLPFHEQDQRIFETIDLAWRWLNVNFGIGEGLTAGTEAFTIKTIVGLSLDAL
jgi:hypothetical protein